MKKLAALTALIAATAAVVFLVFSSPAEAQRPQDIVWATGSGSLLRPEIQIELLAVSATTTTWVNNNRTAVLTSDSCNETMGTRPATVGLDLTNLDGVVVHLATGSAATAGGSLQAYVLNVETGIWNRTPDLDLTTIAATAQSWPALWVAVKRGRLYYNPVGCGSVATTIYLVGQPKS
jgi:hypothetical protein